MTDYKEMLIRARELEEQIGSDWAEDHADAWYEFSEQMDEAYEAGRITAAEHDSLELIACYEPVSIILDDDDEAQWDEILKLEQPRKEYHDANGRKRR